MISFFTKLKELIDRLNAYSNEVHYGKAPPRAQAGGLVIVYQIISITPLSSIENEDYEGRIQVDLYADTPEKMIYLVETLQKELSKIKTLIINYISNDVDTENDVYRATIDITI